MKIETISTQTVKERVLEIESENQELIERIGNNHLKMIEIRKAVVEKEFPVLNKITDFVKSSIDFDEIFSNPDETIDIFRKNDIVPDLEVYKTKDYIWLNKNAKSVVVFDKYGESEISAKKYIIVTSKDKKDVEKILTKNYSDNQERTDLKQFYSKTIESQLIFMRSKQFLSSVDPTSWGRPDGTIYRG